MTAVSTWLGPAGLEAGTIRGLLLRPHAVYGDGSGSMEAGSAYNVRLKTNRSDGDCGGGRLRSSDPIPMRTCVISRQGGALPDEWARMVMPAKGSRCRQPVAAALAQEEGGGKGRYRCARLGSTTVPVVDTSYFENPVGKSLSPDLVSQCGTRGARHRAVICMCDNAVSVDEADVDILARSQTADGSQIDREGSIVGKKGVGDADRGSDEDEATTVGGGEGGGGTGGGERGGGSPWGGGGGGGRGDHDSPGRGRADGGGGDDEFGPVLSATEVRSIVAVQGVDLPDDMATAAVQRGIPAVLLSRYIDLQGRPWPLGPAVRSSGLLRERMIADPTFLFKVLTEISIDSGCATFAEVNKRGTEFWNEFEFYLSDLFVGIVLDVALVGMLAPIVTFGGAVKHTKGLQGTLSRILTQLPNSVFEAASPGRSFTVNQRLATLFVKGAQYGLAGFLCGLVGQGMANSLMSFKRRLNKGGNEVADVPIPPLLKTAACWALFMGVSSNLRYQMINGMERVVEASVIAKHVPQVAMAFTVGIRFANNIYGGMQFVDLARWAGIQ
ncbi:hypothetical protein CBR_g54103 [Chara braunii]|uniref:Uncharacterized protein n=1 Tax=Chara braunii TaxID=69332 RepID=A0A388MBR4_CHABU|nr:hypothetical protein CBR_g54103 [Chara braunii]|eukprot:GBG92008.1 hypothetical protein CBR_g54103 [Chara braunii]